MANKIESKSMLNPTVEIAVADYYLYDSVSGLEVYSGTLSSHEINKTLADPEDVKGGRNGDTIYSISKNADIELVLTDVVNNQELEAQKFGGNIREVGESTIISFHMPKNYKVALNASKLEITLDHTPLVADEIRLYNPKTKKMIDVSKVVVTTNKVAITESGLVEGDTVLVTGFKYKAPSTARYSAISSQDTSATYFGVIEVPIYDLNLDKVIMTKKYIFDKCKMASNVSSKGATERKGVSAEHRLKVVKDLNKSDLGIIIYEDVVAV